MLYRLPILVLAVLATPLLASGQQQEPSVNFVVHGTINIAMGNENGLIVLTDSMLTSAEHQLAEPGQKLFRLDSHSVCAIAGFISADVPIPDLNASTGAIIQEYVRQSAPQKPQSIAERLKVLASLFRQHLSAISNIRDTVGSPTRIDDYRLQIIVAGYDLDDKPKIGRITFRTTSYKGSLDSELDEASIVNVEEKLVWKLNGMPDRAEELLSHPELVPEDRTLNQYRTSQLKNGGRSLSIEQMVELAKRLAFYTSRAHPEVGGRNQIAILKPHEAVRIDQQTFPNPPKPLIQFALLVDSKFSYSSVSVASPAVFVRCVWNGMKRDLDGNFFIGNTFTDSALIYGGLGEVDLGNTNRVIDSILVIEPLVDPNNATITRLMRAFPRLQIRFDLPRGTF